MLNADLRRSGGSLILAIPKAYIEQNNLGVGSKLNIEIEGEELKLRPANKKLSLAKLLDATPKGLLRLDNWDNMPQAGEEI
ncbi:MAG: AbrB/MazE/SpoVT family DNA-binding domain-containing protein [Pseudomonadota bacterium]